MGTMTRLKLAVAFASVACMAACASYPESVSAVKADAAPYGGWSCGQLTDESARLQQELDKVSALQRNNANWDVALVAAGILAFPPLLVGLTMTNDRKDELATLKGKQDAVDQSARTQNCQPSPRAAPAK